MAINKIYSSWAFTENEREKSNSNNKAYKELKEKYIIKQKYEFDKMEIAEQADVDVVFGRAGGGYGHSLYKIYKNKPQLSNLELALICDSGNLCFGHSVFNGMIKIYTD